MAGSQSNVNYTWTPVTDLTNPNIYNPIASPTETTIYIGMGMDDCGNEYIDTFNIIVNTLEVDYEIQPAFSDTTLCEGQSIELTIQTDSNNDITWQDGSTGSSFVITEPGSYEVTLSNDCATASIINMEVDNSNCLVTMPNVFTPDFDGVNDYFGPVSEGDVEILQFKIFNRWGDVCI